MYMNHIHRPRILPESRQSMTDKAWKQDADVGTKERAIREIREDMPMKASGSGKPMRALGVLCYSPYRTIGGNTILFANTLSESAPDTLNLQTRGSPFLSGKSLASD